MNTKWFRTALACISIICASLSARAGYLAVSIINPTNNASFTRPVDILISATAGDPAVAYSVTNVALVNFYAASSSTTAATLIGSQTMSDPKAAGVFSVTWTNAPKGTYSLTAVAVDFQDQRATSAPVKVTINSSYPVVTAAAPDPTAAEPGGNNGLFHVYRTGPTNDPLTVFYQMSGTASNGVDYVLLPGTVAIPAGTNFAPIVLQPIDDTLIEPTETAVLTVVQPPLGATTPYDIGTPASATVSILDNDNQPPTVSIVNPTNGASFDGPMNVLLQAQATDKDGSIFKVYFYAGNSVIGGTGVADSNGLYNVVWTNPPPGTFNVTAVAIDNLESHSTSAPVAVTIKYPLPVVTAAAPDSQASEPGDNTGTFHIYRLGPTNDPLTVFYRMSGTASNGVDYVSLAGTVSIPSGSNFAAIILQPIDDNLVEGTETAVLTIISSPLGAPTTYLVGSPASATISILDNETNQPPSVSIVNPTNGASFTAPTNVLLQASAADSDGSVLRVYFFSGTNVIGGTGVADSNGLYDVTWTNPPIGTFSLTAVAIDNLESHATSAPVAITIIGTPPTNTPPTVHIYTPTNYASFVEPANIFIGAEAADKDGYVKTVEFFENGISLGVKTNNPASTTVINPFYVYWTNVSAGAYDLTALATDNQGATTLSDPIHITVTNAPPPPTNYPPVVRISSPANGATYHMPVNIPIYVYAHDPDGSVDSVEVFAGTNDLGPALQPCHTTTNATVECATNYFVMTWSNAPMGSYALTAVATDNVGASSTSEPVKITVLPLPPPPSNYPPIITITAPDPIAIEGTNCWTWLAPTNRTATWSNWYAGAALPATIVTNCGPKSATFVVHRDGDTNDDLTVNYEIGGTATNGIQYMTLPGSVTIPAGEHVAFITVVPIDDGPPEINMTVILNIKMSTNYTVGLPRRAAAYILDEPKFRPLSEVTSDRCFHLKADGPDGAWFHVDYTTDLTNWTSLCTNQVVNGSIDFIDPDAQADQLRYYRAVPQDAPPTQ